MKYAAPSLKDLSNDRLKELMPRIDAKATLQKKVIYITGTCLNYLATWRTTSEIILQTAYVMKGDLTSSLFTKEQSLSRETIENNVIRHMIPDITIAMPTRRSNHPNQNLVTLPGRRRPLMPSPAIHIRPESGSLIFGSGDA